MTRLNLDIFMDNWTWTSLCYYQKMILASCCKDITALNKIMKKDAYPTPLIREILDELQGAFILSTSRCPSYALSGQPGNDGICLSHGALPFLAHAHDPLQC